MLFSLICLVNVVVAQYTTCLNPNTVAITFDDGPGNNTRAIVDILNKNGVTAAFFVNGIRVIRENRWDDLKYIDAAGHTLASHGFSHAALEQLNDFNIRRELFDNELVFRMSLKKRPRFFRPPYFSYNAAIQNMAQTTFGYALVVSNLDTNDWASLNGTDILQHYKDAVNVSGQSYISLQHEQVTETVDVLDAAIKYIKSKNYRIISLSECLGLQPYQLDNVYGPYLLNGF